MPDLARQRATGALAEMCVAARTLAFALGALFTHQLVELPDALYLGLAPMLLPIAVQRGRGAIGAAFLIGFAWTAVHGQMALDRRLPAHAQGADVVADGRIIEVARAAGDRARFTLQPEHITAPAASTDRLDAWHWQGCRFSVSWYRPGESTRPRAGERWRLVLRLRQPRGLRNVGGYDSEHRALRERRCATAYVRAGSLPMRLPGTHWSLNRLREDIAHRIAAHLHDSAFAGVIVALAVGIRDRISAAQRGTMQLTGTAHLMAISGLHIGLIAALGMLLGRAGARAVPRLLLIVPASHWGAALAFLLALIYAALAGFSIPTQRALLMLSTFLLAMMLGRKVAPHHGLALALLIVIVADPLAVFDAGTWLSFAAVAGLMWAIGPGVPAVAAARESHTAMWRLWLAHGLRRTRLAARVQLAASVVVLPLGLACFAFQSLLSPIANLVAIPITGLLVVPLTLAGVVIDPLAPPLAGELIRMAARLMDWVFVLLQWLAAADLLFIPARAPSIMAMLAAFVGVAVLLSPMTLRLRLTGLFWLAPLIMPPSPTPPTDGLDLQVLDVGQGLAVLLRTHSHAVLFDAGPAWSNGNDAGASVVVPRLRRQGIPQLDRVIISHVHQDHSGGLAGVLRAMPKIALMGDPGDRDLPAEPCTAGQSWRWDGYEFRILHPDPVFANMHGDSKRSGNNSSCVLRVNGPGGSVLLPADIEAPAEAALLRFAARLLRSDIMLVPHHGSRTSSTEAFVQAVQPKLAINSSGHRNRFAMPAAQIFERYAARRIPFIDTACVGAIEVRLRANQAPRVTHWRQSQLRFWHTRDSAEHCRGDARG